MKYRFALTKLHNLIESGILIPEIENENEGVIQGHSKDGRVKFSQTKEYWKINIVRNAKIGEIEYNFRREDEYRSFVLTLVREFD